MNLAALLERLSEKEAALTEIRWGVPYGYLKTVKPLTKIARLKTLIEARIEERHVPTLDAKIQKQIDIGYRNWKSNRRFMSLDVERTEDGAFHEVGITLIRGSSIETFNYLMKGIERGPKFMFGTTISAEFEIIRNLILLHAETADFYIGHSFWNDLSHLEAEGIELPKKFYYDTSLWAKALMGYKPTLYSLTQQYGVGSTQMHCGGNDSRYTAEVFLKMINMHATGA